MRCTGSDSLRTRLSARPRVAAVLLALCAFLAPASAWADERLPSAQEIEERIQTIEADQTLDQAQRTAAVEALREALRNVGAIQSHVRRRSEFDGRRATAPDELAGLQAELARSQDVQLPTSTPPLPVPELEKALASARAEEAERTKAAEALRGGPAAREARLKQIPGELAAARGLLPEAERAIDESGPAGEVGALADARRTRALLRLEMVRAQITELEAEQRALEAEAGLYTARVQVAERAREAAQQIARTWQSIWQERRETEGRLAEAAAERARLETENEDPVARALAESNVELTRVTRRVTEQSNQATLAQQMAQDELDVIDRREADARKRIAAVGLTEAIGFLLRQHRARLSRATDRLKQMVERRSVIADLQLLRFEQEEELEDLRRVVTGSGPAPIGRLYELRADRVGYLEAALAEIDKCVLALVALDTTERQLIARATAYATFIDERVLWIRSTDPLWVHGFAGTADGLAWLTSSDSWKGSLTAMVRQTSRAPLRYVFLLLAYLAIILAGSRMSRAAERPDVLAAKATSFLPTAMRFVADALHALRIPVALLFVGSLFAAGGATSLQRALGAGLVDVAVFLLPLLALRRFLAPGGLARAHFGWTPAATDRVRHALQVVILVGAPLSLLVSVFKRAPNEEWNAGPGRVALVLLLAVSAFFLERVLRPSGGVLTPHTPGSATWLQRTRVLWYLLGVGVPVLLGALALFGYQFTADALADRLEQTVAMVAGLVVLPAMIYRGLVVQRRRAMSGKVPPRPHVDGGLALAEEPASAAAPAPAAPGPPEAHLDAQTAGEHMRQLLRTTAVIVALLGVWFIWVDVLPALGMLRDIEVWSTTDQVARTVVIDGVSTPTAVLEIVPVTLANLLFAVVVLSFTILAARNIPGVLEVLFLNRLVSEPSTRYAISTVARHLIWIVGLVFILGSLGLQWSKIQWLVAALGVGLGFGLQEIFGNFISGLILLFERRIRLGDVVTRGGRFRPGHAHSHPRHYGMQLGAQGVHRPQQGPHHRTRAELDADRRCQSPRRQCRRGLRHGHETRARVDGAGGETASRRRGRPAPLCDLRAVRRQQPAPQHARVHHGSHQAVGDLDRPARSRGEGLRQGGHRDRLSPARSARAQRCTGRVPTAQQGRNGLAGPVEARRRPAGRSDLATPGEPPPPSRGERRPQGPDDSERHPTPCTGHSSDVDAEQTRAESEGQGERRDGGQSARRTVHFLGHTAGQLLWATIAPSRNSSRGTGVSQVAFSAGRRATASRSVARQRRMAST